MKDKKIIVTGKDVINTKEIIKTALYSSDVFIETSPTPLNPIISSQWEQQDSIPISLLYNSLPRIPYISDDFQPSSLPSQQKRDQLRKKRKRKSRHK